MAWLDGNGNPPLDQGKIGDFWYDRLTDAVWRKTHEGWGLIVAETNAPVIIQGPPGRPGRDGRDGGGGDVESVNDKTGVVVLDPDDLDDSATTNKFTTAGEITKLAGIETGAEVNAVDSVNSQTGDVVLDPDDLDDSATTNKFTTAGDITKLDGIEAGADVTDETNVTDALDGATLTAATVAGTDKVLIQDADAADALKTATAQSIADLGGGGDVSAAANIADHAVVRGDGGAKGVQSSGASVDDSGNLTANNLSGTNTGDETAAGLLTKIKTVDGASSGLDADVLDGDQPTTLHGTGTFASASSAKAGRLYLPTDSPYGLLRDDGSNLRNWGPLFRLLPSIESFAWLNQGGASIDTTKGGIYLEGPASTTDSIRGRVASIGAPPGSFARSFAFMPNLSHAGSGEFNYAGVFFRESSTGRIETWNIYKQSIGTPPTNGEVYHSILRWTDTTTFSASAAFRGGWPCPGPLIWMRISDDNTNRVYEVSPNGQHWITIATIARTTFLTADQWGFFVNAQNANFPVGMHLLHVGN